MAEFFFSRYHVTTDGNYTNNKAQFLLDGISGDAEITYRKDNFRFVYSQVERVGNKSFIVGQMAKYKPEDEQKVINEDHAIDNVQLRNRVLTTVRFIIDIESSIIIYEESRSHVPKDSFSKRFTELFYKNYEGVFVDLVISPITEQYTFSERIRTLAMIKKIVINLVPSNPNNADLWEDVDNRLRENHITNYKEIQENKREGEGIVIDSETESKFFMSEDGYGVTTAQAIDEDGKPVTISTKDANKAAKVSLPNDIDGLRAVIEACQEKLNEIIRRTNEV